MPTEIRVCSYEGDFQELLGRYSPKFIPIGIGEANVKKYGLIEREGDEKYLVMVSRCSPTTNWYNLMISVTGAEAEKTRAKMSRFEQLVEVPLLEAPEEIRQRQQVAIKIIEFLFRR